MAARPLAQGDDVHLRAEAPIVAVDGRGHPKGVRFHERSMAPLAIDADLADRFYPALRRFARAVRGGTLTWRVLLVGEAVVYDNQRVLHGRTAAWTVRDRDGVSTAAERQPVVGCDWMGGLGAGHPSMSKGVLSITT